MEPKPTRRRGRKATDGPAGRRPSAGGGRVDRVRSTNPAPPNADSIEAPARKPAAPRISPAEQRVVAGVLDMYRQGWFPMSEDVGDDAKRLVQWVQPQMRGIIPLEPDRFTISRSLRSLVRRGKFVITTDCAFGDVIRACAKPAKGREQTWLAPEIIDAFELLHRAGHAHSIEAWLVPSLPPCTGGLPAPRADSASSPPSPPSALRTRGLPARSFSSSSPSSSSSSSSSSSCTAGLPAPRSNAPVLVGGLYGLALGSVFAGESMFSRPDLGGTDASKACLVHLVHHLRRQGFSLLDSQLTNEHLAQFGCYELPREQYLEQLAASASNARQWGPFEPERTIQELTTIRA